LKRNPFPRNLEIVARELLGKILVRKFENKNFSGRIVEDEAYFGKKILLLELN